MNSQEASRESAWIEEFENLYIETYPILYRHGKLIFSQEDQVKELLALTYMEAYQRREQLQKEKVPADWLRKRADFWAETKLEATKDMLEASYAEEKMQSKEAKKEQRSNLDETTVLLEIEDRLGIVDGQESSEEGSVALTSFKGILSIVMLMAAVIATVAGIMKMKNQMEVLQAPFERTFAEEDLSAEAEAEKNRIQVGDTVVYLSDIGEVLYSLPLEETDLAGADPLCPEIQKMDDGWTYYLPCPERENSQLSQVQPALFHTLYRLAADGQELEIVAAEVDSYTITETDIYVNQYGRIQRIGMDEAFDKIQPGYYVKVKDEDIYLYDTLGRTLNGAADGTIHFGGQAFEMFSNRVLDVKPDQMEKDGVSYYLKAMEDEPDKTAIYCRKNGQETLFEKQGRTIDSFCIAGDWLYYSAYMRRGGSGAHYSRIFKKSLTEEDAKAESLRNEFAGRLRQMYYSENADQIYANYTPRNWKNNYGVIAVISLSGQMSYLDDEELREGVETSGNDFLEFVMMQDGQVYCYWKDCYWENGEDPIVKWRKVLVIPDRNRIMVRE